MTHFYGWKSTAEFCPVKFIVCSHFLSFDVFFLHFFALFFLFFSFLYVIYIIAQNLKPQFIEVDTFLLFFGLRNVALLQNILSKILSICRVATVVSLILIIYPSFTGSHLLYLFEFIFVDHLLTFFIFFFFFLLI